MKKELTYMQEMILKFVVMITASVILLMTTSII